MLRSPSACEPSSSDSRPAIVESRGVRCGIISIPASRWIAADAIRPLMRARARGLSFTSTTCALPDSRIVRAASIRPATLPPSGGSSWTETTNSPVASSRASSVGSSCARRRDGGLAPRARVRRLWRGAVLVDRLRGSPRSARASCRSSRRSGARRAHARRAANSPKYSGVACGNESRAPVIVASPTFGSAASAAPSPDISASAVSAAAGPRPWFAPKAATSSARSRSAASRAVTPADRDGVAVEAHQRDDRERGDASARPRSPPRARRGRRTSRA